MKPSVSLFFFLTALLLNGCVSKTEKTPPVAVAVYTVLPQDIPAVFRFVGVAKSFHPVEIRSRVEGYLNSIDYTEGAFVEAGKQLFQIDPRQFLASLEEAEGELARQEAVLWRAKRSLERIEPLFEQNAASRRDLDNATAQVLTAEADVISAKANVKQAELNLSYTDIISPIKGWTGRALYREGTLITPSINGLLTVVSVIDPIWVDFSISDEELLLGRAEGEAHKLILPEKNDYTVTLELSDGSEFSHKGKINFTSPTLDPQTGTLVVRSQFDNPEGEILPGQFVRAAVSGAIWRDALAVPQSSVFQGRKGMYVFVVQQNHTVSMRLVKPGVRFKTYWIIEEGLAGGDVVVAEGINKLREGTEINIINAREAQNLPQTEESDEALHSTDVGKC